MGEISNRIAAVIAARRERLPEIQAQIALWRRADDAVVELQLATAVLCGYGTTPMDVAIRLGQLRIAEARVSITAAIRLVQLVEARVGRRTICMGVSGTAGTGKSTILQSISGLTDAQVPTGADAPVTAVPSRIFHTPGRRRAVLTPHTFDTFRAAHLQPRYAEVGLGEPPADVEAFRATSYPEPNGAADHAAPLNELREMQEALWSYERLLDRRGKALVLTGDEFDQLPEYVAYPTTKERGVPKPARRYLAVRDARIECAFPRADLGAIAIVDLPGLGRGPADAERHQVAGLRHDLDFVFLVKRAVGTAASWAESDSATMALLDQMRGFAGRRRDFVFIVLNTDMAAEQLVDGVPGGVGGDRDGPGYRLLEVNGKDPAEVSARLLRPVLLHLVEGLPAMDADVFAGTRAMTGPVRDELVGMAVETKAVLRQVPRLTPDTAEELYRRADELHGNLAGALPGLLAELRDRAARDDPDFRAAVSGIHDNIVGWVRDGHGVGHDGWRAEAVRGMIRDGGLDQFATAQFDRVRVEICDRYAAIDRYLSRRLEEVWVDVAAVLSGELGALLGDRSGSEALAHLAELATVAAEPCPVWRAAIGELLATRLDYRTHLHPRVRSELDALVPPVHEEATEDAVEALYGIIRERAEQAAWRIRARLLGEVALPGQVLFAAVEHFTDALIGSGAAELEIRQLARSYRGELWVGVFPELDAADARVARVAKAADELLAVTTELSGPVS